MLRLTNRSENLRQAAYVWSRHRHMIPFAAAAFIALAAVATWAELPTWSARIAVGAAGAAVAVNATTDYRVIGLTDERIIVAQASRIRQVARMVHSSLDLDVPMEPIAGGGLVTTTWRVGEAHYTVPRGSQIAMEDMRAQLAT